MIIQLKNAKNVIYFSWFEYITNKHLCILNDIGVNPKIVSSEDIVQFDLSQYSPDDTLLIAQTSCLAVNRLFTSKAFSTYRKILFQDGMRIYPPLKNGLKFKISLVLDKISSRWFHHLNQVYYKNFYDYYFLTSQAAVDEAINSYHISERRIYLYQDNSKRVYEPFLPFNKSKLRVIFIDQPVEKVFGLSDEKTMELYSEIYQKLSKVISSENIYLKPHPSTDYNRKLRGSFENLVEEFIGVHNDIIMVTFYSTLGFELLQQGFIVIFLNIKGVFSIDNIFITTIENLIVKIASINNIVMLDKNRNELLGYFK